MITSINPATGEIIWETQAATQQSIHQAVLRAHDAFIPWSRRPLEERARYLQSFAAAVESQRDALAVMIARETGKPLWEALTEVSAVIGKIAISLQSYQERQATQIKQTTDGQTALRFKPHGVVVVLGAFNFPAHLSNGHIVPALLAGNTVLYKPSELTPAVADLIMQCWQAAKLPSGVLQCVQGDAKVGQHLLSSDIQGVFFTGSYQVGKTIHAQFAGRPEVILALEMGGNNPLIIDEVDDIEEAIDITIRSAFITAGQRCTCARRIFIPDSEWGNDFLQQLINSTQALKVGAYTERPEPFMGPVIRYEHALKHLASQDKLIKLGGKSLLTMTLLHENTGLLSPGIIDVTDLHELPDEEIFAPFAQIIRYATFDEALERANQTHYGLAAGLISDNHAYYQRFYETIHAGLINWNKPTTGASSQLPFGGIGYSGNHRPSAYFAADYCAYPVACQEKGLFIDEH